MAVNYVIQNTPLQAQKNVTVQNGGFGGTTHIVYILPADTTTHTVSASSFNISNGTPQPAYDGTMQYVNGVGGVTLPDGVDSVEFSDTNSDNLANNTVKVTCNLNPNFYISSPITLTLDIDGDADLIVQQEIAQPNWFNIFVCGSLPSAGAFAAPNYCHLEGLTTQESITALTVDSNYMGMMQWTNGFEGTASYGDANCAVSGYAGNSFYRVFQLANPPNWSQPVMNNGGQLKYYYKPHINPNNVSDSTANYGNQYPDEQVYTVSRHNCSINGDTGTSSQNSTTFFDPLVYVGTQFGAENSSPPGFVETTGIISSVTVSDVTWPYISQSGVGVTDVTENTLLPSVTSSDMSNLSSLGLSPADWIGNRLEVKVSGLQGYTPNVMVDLYGICNIYVILNISPMLIGPNDVPSNTYDISIDIPGETDINSTNGSTDG
jgi:hypothetical protein